MADERKRETQRERALIDPVLKFLFDKDREEIVRLMLGTPMSIVQVLDSVLPSGEQRSDGVLLVEDAGDQETRNAQGHHSGIAALRACS